VPALPAVMRRFGHYGHYLDWLGHPEPGPFWERLSPRHEATSVRLPALHIGGWYDGMLTGTLGAYRALAGRADAGPQRLVVGPWVHIPWAREVGGLDFGAAATNRIDQLQLRWFDHWLKGIDTGLLAEPPSGFSRWAARARLPAWPERPPRILHLTSAGRAGLDPAEGKLVEALPPSGEDALVYDPWRPTPSSGGHAAYPPGPSDRRTIDARSDVLTYTTPALEADLHLAGDVAAELFIAADQPSFDVSAVLAEVRPDGRVVNLTEGYARLDHAAAPIRLGMRATCARLARGSALRLAVAAAASQRIRQCRRRHAPGGDAAHRPSYHHALAPAWRRRAVAALPAVVPPP